MSKPELLIEVYTDPMCPWCWIGHARLESTLKSSDFEDKVGRYMKPRVRLLPYVLDPRLPATSGGRPSEHYERLETTNYESEREPPSKREYYTIKFAAGLDAFDQRITKAAKDVGIEGFQWLTDGKVGATWDAHRILWLAGQKSDADASSEAYKPDLQMKASARLYRDYHALSKDLSDRTYLAAAATELGLFESQEEAKKWLESDEGEYELGQGIAVARMNGIDSIPQVVIQDGSDHLSEVGTHETFMRMFEMAAAAHR